MIYTKNRRRFFAYSVISFLFVITFLSLTSAETFKQWEDYQIRHPIRINGGIDASIVANVTVKDPDGLVTVNFQQMTYDTTSQEHNYTVGGGLNGEIGVYPYCITATNGAENQTSCFTYEITPSGSKGLLGFYFLITILSYGVLGFGIWKRDITISVLGSMGLFFLALYILFYGIDTFKNSFTEGFAILTLGVAMYVTAKATHEYITG